MYTTMTDEELVALAQQGDWRAERHLLKHYQKMIRSMVRSYYILGGDTDDLIQEGLIAVSTAISKYRPAHSASFSTYAGVIIRNHIINAVKMASRRRHEPLNTAKSLFSQDAGGFPISESLAADESNPEESVIKQEVWDEVEKSFRMKLSRLERTVLYHYLGGMRYTDMAINMGVSEKTIDNALQRIKNKLTAPRESVTKRGLHLLKERFPIL